MIQPDDWMISVDDHVIEPPHVWQRYIPSRYAEEAPKVVQGDDGVWAWHYDGRRTPITGLSAVAGTPSETWDLAPMNLVDPPVAAYSDPTARLAVMDEDGVLASMVYPTFARFCGQTFLEARDKDLALACIQAYNDWMTEEWMKAAPGRYLGLALVPMWDGELAAREARRAAAKGAHSIAFSENPSKLGLPSIHDRERRWDPLFAACSELGLPLSIHIGSSSEIRVVSPDAPLIEGASLMVLAAQDTVIDWIWSGNFARFPDLKIVLSESGVAWVPPLLEQMRRVLHRWRWARTKESSFGGNVLTGDPRPVNGHTPFGDIPVGFDPVEAFHQSIFPCVVADDYGWDALAYLGPDNVLIETDYPHPDSFYPNSAVIAKERLAHLDPATRRNVLRENACRVFGFTPAPVDGASVS